MDTLSIIGTVVAGAVAADFTVNTVRERRGVKMTAADRKAARMAARRAKQGSKAKPVGVVCGSVDTGVSAALYYKAVWSDRWSWVKSLFTTKKKAKS